MKATIMYDNTAEEGFRSGWGFACLIDRRILFDTGEDPESLFHNFEQTGLDASDIEAVVISHDHWDHTGGLWELLKKRPGLRVYACPGFSSTFKDKVDQLQGTLIESETYRQIDKGISVTGQIPGQYKGGYMPEEALMVNTEKGIAVITGCSHPGIITIVQTVKTIFPRPEIALVLGGFHLMNQNSGALRSIAQSMQELGVKSVGPTHCTGREAQAIFREIYGDHYISVAAGKTVEL